MSTAALYLAWAFGDHVACTRPMERMFLRAATPAGESMQHDRSTATAPTSRPPRATGTPFGELWRHAPVTGLLIAANLGIFVLMVICGADITHVSGRDAIRWGSDYGPLTTSGQWWRLVTAVFVHLGMVHVVMNMYALYQAGRIAERLFGSLRFTLLYLFAGVAGGMASELWNPQVNSAGASGAIFGVFGALLAFMTRRHLRASAPGLVPAGISLMIFGSYSLIYGFSHQGVDNAAHVGGLAGGFAMGLALSRPLTIPSRATTGWGQIATAFLGGLIALAATAWPLTHPSPDTLAIRHFRQLMDEFHAREVAATAANNRVNREAKTRKLDAPQYADALERDALPQWQALYNEVAAVSLPPGKDRAVQEQLIRYVADRRDEIADIIRGNREGNPLFFDQARQRSADADAAIGVLKGLSVQ